MNDFEILNKQEPELYAESEHTLVYKVGNITKGSMKDVAVITQNKGGELDKQIPPIPFMRLQTFCPYEKFKLINESPH